MARRLDEQVKMRQGGLRFPYAVRASHPPTCTAGTGV